ENALADALDGLDTVVQKINLALSLQFAIDRIANDTFVVAADDCLHGQTIERRRFNGGHIFHADEREIKSAGNRRGRKCEYVHQLEQLLEFFFMQNAEALFFVDDDDAEILENNVTRNQPMG